MGGAIHRRTGRVQRAAPGAAALRGIAATLIGLALMTGTGVCDPGAVPASNGLDEILVLIDETDEGLYQVIGRFWVDATIDQSWEVLTDYENIDRFTSSVASSRVTRSDSLRHLVEQQAAVGMFIFKKRMQVSLQVDEIPKRQIDFRDIEQKDLARYQGSWLLEPWQGGVRITYTMEALPKKSMPHFLERMMVNRSSVGLLREVREEIERRAGG